MTSESNEREEGRREATLAVLNALAGRIESMRKGDEEFDRTEARAMIHAIHIVCVEQGTGYPSRDKNTWRKFHA